VAEAHVHEGREAGVLEEARWSQATPRQQVQDAGGIKIESSRLRNVRGSSDIVLIEFTDYEWSY
jgi:hypothetical protein